MQENGHQRIVLNLNHIFRKSFCNCHL